MNSGSRKRNRIEDKLTYAYIRRIKRWMFCPVCKQGKMTINKKSTIWVCEDCGYRLSGEEFEDNYVFWFCDECDTYLNNQEGFDRNATRHICPKCGYENDTTFDNVKGNCSDCGKVILDPDGTLCVDCRLARRQKAKEWLASAGKVVGAAVAVAGAVYLVSKASNAKERFDYKPLLGGDGEGGTEKRFDFITDHWMKTASEDELRLVEEEMRAKLGLMEYDSREYLQLDSKRIDIVNAISSKFPLNIPHREQGWYLPNDD